MVKRCHVALVATLLMMVTACAGPVTNVGGPSFALGVPTLVENGDSRLTIDLAPLFGRARQLASVVDEVETVVVRVVSVGHSPITKTAARADFLAGRTQLTFSGLPVGEVHLRAEVFDSAGISRGFQDRTVNVRAGEQTPVSLIMIVRETYDYPSHDPSTLGNVQATVSLVDGPVVYGASPTPRPTPTSAVFANLDLVFDPSIHIGYQYKSLAIAISQAGYVAMSGDSGTTLWDLSHEPIYLDWAGVQPTFYPYLHFDQHDRLWVVDSMWGEPARVHKFDTNGKRIVTAALTGDVRILEYALGADVTVKAPHCLVMDAAGNAWVANGSQVTKLSPSGTVLGNFPVGAPVKEIEIDPVSGNLWITYRNAARVARMAPDGQVVSTTLVSAMGDVLSGICVDREGNAWVGEEYSQRVAKILPDGSLAGHVQLETIYPVCHLELDAAGHVLALSRMGLWQIDGGGTILRRYPGLDAPNIVLGPGGGLYTMQNSDGVVRISL